MSNAAPPAWVLALPIGSGQWRYLVKAWGYGPFKNAKPDAPPLTEAARAKACNATIAARSGQPKSTAAKQALALAGAGWVRRDADGYLTLASWRAPHVFTLDAAVEAGLVVRGDDGALSWPHPASGATQPTDGVPHTTDGSTRSRGAPNPPVVHPQPATGATHTTDGSQSCLSSLSSFGLEVEARDPHDLAAALEAAPTPPRKPSSNMVVSGKPRAPRRQAREQSGVLEPVDPWPARVREASESEDTWRQNRARIEIETQRAREAAPLTGAMPSGTKLPLDVFKAIEAHDNGAWSTSVASLTWADACADTMDGDNLDLAHVLRLLDAWTAEARPTRQPSQPSKRVLWYTYGDQGRRARAWVERAMESTRASLRVVSDVDAYEIELAEFAR